MLVGELANQRFIESLFGFSEPAENAAIFGLIEPQKGSLAG